MTVAQITATQITATNDVRKDKEVMLLQLDFNIDKPIFLQVAEEIEDAILQGAFIEESQIPSITEISVTYKINPATALKGINILVDSEILYKKRGVGMFVSTGAVSKLMDKRKDNFYNNYIQQLINEASRLQLTESEIITMIKRGFNR